MTLTPLKAIRLKCLECTGNIRLVKKCDSNICSLFIYRLGTNPIRKGIGGGLENFRINKNGMSAKNNKNSLVGGILSKTHQKLKVEKSLEKGIRGGLSNFKSETSHSSGEILAKKGIVEVVARALVV